MSSIRVVYNVSGPMLNHQDHHTFIQTKARVLGYLRGSIQIPQPDGSVHPQGALDGDCDTQADANRLIAALAQSLPGVTFTVTPRSIPDVRDIIWYRVE